MEDPAALIMNAKKKKETEGKQEIDSHTVDIDLWVKSTFNHFLPALVALNS